MSHDSISFLPTPEAGAPAFDIGQYEVLTQRANGVLEMPHDPDSEKQGVRDLRYLRANQETLGQSLYTDSAATTIDMLQCLARACEQPRAFTSYTLAGSYNKTLSALTVDDLGEDLVSYARANPNSAEETSIENILFAGLCYRTGQPAVTQFIAEKAPAIVARRSQREFQNYSERFFAADLDVGALGSLLLHADDELTKASLRSCFPQIEHMAKNDPHVENILQRIIGVNKKEQDVLFRLYGLPPRIMRIALNAGNSKKHEEAYSHRQQTIRRILAIEGAEPGAARTLYRENRIRNFGRLSEELLLEQYRQRGKKFGTNFFLLFNMLDENGSSARNSAPKLEALMAQLKKDYPQEDIGVRVAEFNGGKDLKRLGRIAAFLDIGPASLVIIDSHSYEAKLLVKGTAVSNMQTKRWLGALTAEHTTDYALLFICACSALRLKTSLGPSLAAAANRRVVGSRWGFSLRRVTGRIDEQGAVSLDIVPARNDSEVTIATPTLSGVKLEPLHNKPPQKPMQVSHPRGIIRLWRRIRDSFR